MIVFSKWQYIRILKTCKTLDIHVKVTFVLYFIFITSNTIQARFLLQKLLRQGFRNVRNIGGTTTKAYKQLYKLHIIHLTRNYTFTNITDDF